MIRSHLRKLKYRSEISVAEEQAIRAAVAFVREIPADQVFIRQGQPLNESILLLDGWMARTTDLPGGQRQVTELHIAGDFPDLHGFTLGRLDHDLVTMSRCTVGVVPHDHLVRITEEFPRLTWVYWFTTNLDAALHREWLISLGRRTAIARMAHLFCELFVRLQIVGLTKDNSYEFPLTQAELAECLGLTGVHVNRTLQELRRMKLVEVANRNVEILDRRGLEGVAEFDPAYLYLGKTIQ